MKVKGTKDPGRVSIEEIPETNKTLIRLFQNVEPYKDEGFEGFQYDEYHVRVETWDGVLQNVLDNYDEFLKKGMDNEVSRTNESLLYAHIDTDKMAIDHEFRITMMELGLN